MNTNLINDMKKQFSAMSHIKFLGLSVIMMSLMTVAIQAAPPLRGLVPMKVGNRTLVAPTDVQQVFAE